MLTYKKATRDQVDIIEYIEKECFTRYFDKVLSLEEICESFDELNETKGDIRFVYYNDDLVGYYCWKELSATTGEVSDLAILPKYQKKGFGSEVLKHLTEEMERYNKVKIVVHPNNTGAQITYLKNGFTPKEIIPNYYNDGEPMVIMVRGK